MQHLLPTIGIKGFHSYPYPHLRTTYMDIFSLAMYNECEWVQIPREMSTKTQKGIRSPICNEETP